MSGIDLQKEMEKRVGALTPRELEVMKRAIKGMLNKQIPFELGTAIKTIKVHRSRVMQKMEAESVADLVRLAEKAGIVVSERASTLKSLQVAAAAALDFLSTVVYTEAPILHPGLRTDRLPVISMRIDPCRTRRRGLFKCDNDAPPDAARTRRTTEDTWVTHR